MVLLLTMNVGADGIPRDLDGRAYEMCPAGEVERLRSRVAELERDKVRLVAACGRAARWVARNTPLVDSDDPVLGPVADAADAIREDLVAAIRETTA